MRSGGPASENRPAMAALAEHEPTAAASAAMAAAFGAARLPEVAGILRALLECPPRPLTGRPTGTDRVVIVTGAPHLWAVARGHEWRVWAQPANPAHNPTPVTEVFKCGSDPTVMCPFPIGGVSALPDPPATIVRYVPPGDGTLTVHYTEGAGPERSGTGANRRTLAWNEAHIEVHAMRQMCLVESSGEALVAVAYPANDAPEIDSLQLRRVRMGTGKPVCTMESWMAVPEKLRRSSRYYNAAWGRPAICWDRRLGAATDGALFGLFEPALTFAFGPRLLLHLCIGADRATLVGSICGGAVDLLSIPGTNNLLLLGKCDISVMDVSRPGLGSSVLAPLHLDATPPPGTGAPDSSDAFSFTLDTYHHAAVVDRYDGRSLTLCPLPDRLFAPPACSRACHCSAVAAAAG